MRGTKWPVGALLALLVLAESFHGGARAAPAALTEAPRGVFGVVAVRSVEAVLELGREVGLPLPPTDAAAEYIEREYLPALRGGALATDRPFGLVFVGGPDVGPGGARVSVMPVKPGVASLDALLKLAESRPVPGQPDAVVIGPSFVRRTKDYAIVGGSASSVAAASDAAIADALLKAGDAQAVLGLDLKAYRRAMPGATAAFVAQFRKDVGKDNAAYLFLPDLLIKPLLRAAGTWDRLDATLVRNAEGIRLSATGRPVKPPAVVAAGPQPGMPDGCVERLDLSFSPTALAGAAFDESLTGGVDAIVKDGGVQLTAAQSAQLHDIAARAARLTVGGSAISVGLEFAAGGDLVVYAVMTFAAPIDYPAQMGKLAGAANAFAAQFGEGAVMDLQTYRSGDETVTRLRLLDKARPVAHLDAVQRGNTVYLAGSGREFRYIDRLLAAKPEAAAARGLASGWVDCGKAFDAAVAMPGTPAAALADEQRTECGRRLAGQRVTFGAAVEGDALVLDVAASDALVKSARKVADVLRGR